MHSEQRVARILGCAITIMANRINARLITAVAAAAILLFASGRAHGNAISYSFTGTSADNHGSATCVYAFDDSSDTILSSWSCSGEFGTFSSSDSGANAFVSEDAPGPNLDTFFFHQFPSGGDTVEFTVSDPSDAGTIVSGDFADILGDHGFASGSVGITPEPSSFCMLGTGLLALGYRVRKRFRFRP